MKHFYITSVLLVSVAAVALAAAKPKWVKQRPNDPAYYIGIGTVPKTAGEYNYVTQARHTALKEMSSEIKVTVSANSILRQFENDYAIKEEFESKVQTSVTQTLEGYEVLTWEDKHEYWVMMRLSKDKYAMNRRLALDKARKSAAMFYQSAGASLADGDFGQSIMFYIKAVESIANCMEEDLTYKSIDGDINLGVAIYQGIRKVYDKIDLTAPQGLYSIKFSQASHLPIVVEARCKKVDNGQLPIANLPIRFAFSRGDGVLSQEASTNGDGQATSSVARLISKRRLQEVTASLDVQRFMSEQQKGTPLYNAFFSPESMPKVTIPIEVLKAKAYWGPTETVFGQPSTVAIFSNQVKALLSENFFTFTAQKEEADVWVKLSSEFLAGEEKKGNGYSVFIVYGDFRLSVIDVKSGTEVFADGASSIKGMTPGDYERALKNCREKCAELTERLIVPKLEQLDLAGN